MQPSPALSPLALTRAVLVGSGILLAAPTIAHANATLATANGGITLQEARFVHNVEFKGLFASVESTQVISNPSDRAQEAIYTFDLPVTAAVRGLRVRLADGRTTTSAIVDAEASLTTMADPAAVDATPDVGLLRLIARDKPGINGPAPFAKATYELRVSPLAARKTVTVTYRWVASLEHVDGSLSLRIPGRGDAGNLVRERVRLSLQPPGGVRGYTSVFGGGKRLGKKRSFTAAPRGDLLIEAGLDFGGRTDRPVVAFGTAPLGAETGAFAVSILSPRIKASGKLMEYQRVLLLADISRSLGAKGLQATAALADGLLADLPSGTKVELLTFDRRVTRRLGGFQKNGAQTRKRVASALRPGTMENGSDLGAALEVARRILRQGPQRRVLDERAAKTLVVLFTDGMVPLSLDGRTAIERIGSDVLEDIQLFPVVLVPDNAPLPDTARGTMAELAYATSGGRALAVRMSNATTVAKNLSSRLNRPAPLTDLRLEAKNGVIKDIALPFSMVPGQGLVAVGSYAAGRPSGITLHARQRNQPLVFTGKKDPVFSKMGGALSLVQMVPADFVSADARVGRHTSSAYDGGTLAAARRQLIKAASKHSAVTRHSSLVALLARDPFARDRLAMVRKWGASAFMRLPPPAERVGDHELRTFAERAVERDPDDADGQRTGELDRDIIKRLLSNHVLPKARGCYQQALRRDATLQGALIVTIEVVRGEVQFAGVERSTFTSKALNDCVAEAAYSIRVPRVALGGDPETVGVARYPLTFKPSKRGGEVEAGAYRAPEVDKILLDTDPLGGLPAGGGDEAD